MRARQLQPWKLNGCARFWGEGAFNLGSIFQLEGSFLFLEEIYIKSSPSVLEVFKLMTGQ